MVLCQMCITEHLSTLKHICHLFAHSTSLLISSSSSIMSSGFLGLWQSLVSSANFDILLTILVSRSFMHIRNSCRPNTLPCGTPDVTGAQLLYGIGRCIPVGDDQLTSFGSIWLHHLECHVHWLLSNVQVFHRFRLSS